MDEEMIKRTGKQLERVSDLLTTLVYKNKKLNEDNENLRRALRLITRTSPFANNGTDDKPATYQWCIYCLKTGLGHKENCSYVLANEALEESWGDLWKC